MAFEFELVSPEALVLSGEATQVVVPGSEGYFTVMENHSAMMSTIQSGVIDVTMADGKSEHYFVRGGFADVSPSGLTVLTEDATHIKELDMAELEREIHEARAAVEAANGVEDMKKAATKLQEFENSLAAVRHIQQS